MPSIIYVLNNSTLLFIKYAIYVIKLCQCLTLFSYAFLDSRSVHIN